MLDLLQSQTFVEWHWEAMQGTLGLLKEWKEGFVEVK